MNPDLHAVPRQPVAPPVNGLAAGSGYGGYDDLDASASGPTPDALVIEAAQAAGLPVIPHADVNLEPAAVRAVPDDAAGIGVAFRQGFLVVAFSSVPSPTTVDEVQHQVGMPIRIAVAPPHVFEELKIQAHDARRADVPLTERILDQALMLRASDVHLSVGTPPTVRMGGHLAPLEGWDPLSASDLEHIAEYLAGDRVHTDFNGDLDLAATYGNWRFRVNLFHQRDALAAALRIIPNQIPPFDSLGLPDVIRKFANLRQGVVLVCGPTGSGKSTTLASLIDIINQQRAEHVVTIEDPIEYLHGNQLSLIQQREVGEDTDSFATAMKSVLRQDPDVILVGEMRDLETISTALTAAETGHLVFSTLHATDAPGVIDRIIDAFPPDQQAQIRVQLANTLEGIVCQSLLPSSAEPGERVAITEVMVTTPAIRNHIREGATHQITTAMQAGIDDHGMQPRDLALAMAVRDGKITDQLARTWVSDPVAYREYLAKIRKRIEF